MEIEDKKNDKAVIIKINGRLDTTNYSQLEKCITNYIDAGDIRLLVDCSEMDYVSSSGLRVFLMALKKITALKGVFAICGLQPAIREIFEISGFTSIFSIYKDQQEAEVSL